MSDEFITGMIRKIGEGSYTRDELSAFLQALDALDEASYIRVFNDLYRDTVSRAPGEIDPLFKARLEARLDGMPVTAGAVKESGVPVVSMQSRRRWFRWTAAAVLVLLAAGAVYIYSNRANEKPAIASVSRKQDVLPPSAIRASITLANGQKVFLDSTGYGTMAVQGNVTVVKKADGRVVYNGSAPPAYGSVVGYNTLSNPRGSKPVSLTLSDGTAVWLNSESSLTYPTVFAGKTRPVTITGEAYFEVAKNTSMPFTVTNGNTVITVLGTHFNINAYADETNMKVTLLEGLVKVRQGAASGLLRPGQQAQAGTDIKVINNIDVAEVMAWKEGKFLFGEKAGIAAIMRQVARWYDVEVEYQGTVSKHFWGSIPRNVHLSQLLRMLETTGGVHFKIEGKKVIVMP